MNTIIVQMAEARWTKEALHLACAMALNTRSKVVLLRLIETQHYSWLGVSFGMDSFSAEESASFWDYKAIAEKYGVELCIQPMQYVSRIDALVEASDILECEAVFACIPASTIPMWRKAQVWELRRQLQQRHKTLYTLDQPVQSLTFASQSSAAQSSVTQS